MGSDFVEEGRKAGTLAAREQGEDSRGRYRHRRATGHGRVGAGQRVLARLSGDRAHQPALQDHSLADGRLHARARQGSDGRRS